MASKKQYNVFWFRRDLRFDDNKGLYHALKGTNKVIPLFIFDTDIIHKLPENDARLYFIYQQLKELQNQLQKTHGTFLIIKGKPLEIFKKLSKDYSIQCVYTNQDHEPYGIERDAEIKSYLDSRNIKFDLYLDHLLMGKNDVLKSDGTPYTVFTPYKNKFKELLTDQVFPYFSSEDFLKNIAVIKGMKFPKMEDLNIVSSSIIFPEKKYDFGLIESYHETRDYPFKKGTSRLGMHLRFGTISLRVLARNSVIRNEIFFNELIWREFYAMILWHFPHVMDKSFKPKYDSINWINNEQQFESWKQGKTGYPMVDAGMRELARTGYMHNRVRMITASFLTKHLLIDWRWGEHWFANKLLDYELSSNNGGWQWAAGSGCDAAPYFRIFNPTEQQKKFDSRGEYVKRWIPEIHTQEYPTPIIEHKFARERCLNTFKKALNN